MLKKTIRMIPALFLLFTLTIRIDYRLDAPGGITPLTSFVTFDNQAVSTSDLNSVYVMTFNRPTLFQWMVAEFFDSIDTVKLSGFNGQITNTDRFESGQVARNSAIQKSIVSAYELLDIEITYETWWLLNLKYESVEADLEIGDRIVRVNDRDDVLEALSDVACGTYAYLDVEREGTVFNTEIKKHEDTCLFGIRLSEYLHITELAVDYQSEASLIGGPSAGLMQTLYIYDALSEKNLLEAFKIAGTGTIQLDGSIGSVGAIKQKIYTVHQNDVDVFFVPSGSNYNEAKSVYDTLNQPQFDLVEVHTFEDVILYLEALYEHD